MFRKITENIFGLLGAVTFRVFLYIIKNDNEEENKENKETPQEKREKLRKYFKENGYSKDKQSPKEKNV